MSQHLLTNIRKHASKKMGSVNDESWKTEMTFEIEGTQLYANKTALSIDGSVFDLPFGDFNSRTTTSIWKSYMWTMELECSFWDSRISGYYIVPALYEGDCIVSY